ncbi:MAG: DNA polymerase III subunit delta' [Pseudomonadota bacterium]|nr:DNA polymerase III subunit delta' [Pseudomonadota bacterium]
MSIVNDQVHDVALSRDEDFRPWQMTEAQHLICAYQSNTLPHALILTGPLGISKQHFAEQFAFFLLCTSPDAGRACGCCKSCLLSLAGNHPDWMNIGPEEAHKVIRIDTIRMINQRLHQTSQQGGNKVCIICPAENMNENAANALLKSLEEPPADTYFLLVVHQISKILPTILSRAQRVNFALPSANSIMDWLKSDFNQLDIEHAIERARGFPERVKSILLESDGVQFDNDTLIELMLGKRSGYDFAAKLDQRGAASFLDAMLVLLARQSNANLTKSSEELTILNAISQQQRHEIFALAINAKQAIAQNANLRLLMETFLQDCTTFFQTSRD